MTYNEEYNKREKEKFDVYANGMNITFGPFDFVISFTKSTSSGNEDLGEITMSPEHLKVFATILEENVKNYENLFGEIPDVHPTVLKQLSEEGKLTIERDRNE